MLELTTERQRKKLPEHMKLTQETLRALGYTPGPIDGIMGSGTAAALRAFQQREGLNLRQAPASAGNPWNRVILRVRGVDALHRDLVEKGLAPTEPKDAEWGERYFELSDPQGVVISFAELL